MGILDSGVTARNARGEPCPPKYIREDARRRAQEVI